jgi:uncharacterized protein YnzC (UPF0291/DUF896 family)
MNIYIPKNESKEFLEKLKEIRIVDDYKLDSSRFGKEKIKIQSRYSNVENIQYLLPYLPQQSVIIANTEYPGKEYILCVGEINFSDFYSLKETDAIISIITKYPSTIRFNAWVHFSKLNEFFHNKFIKNLTSINGKIGSKTYFIIEAHENDIDFLHKIITNYSNEMIIKENKLFVKLLLHDFSKLYEQIQNNYEKIEIIDEQGEFLL